MSEWWTEGSTYRPSDFLMFSPRIYWRLFQSLNEACWPAQPLLLAAGLGWLGWSMRRTGASGPAITRAGAGWPMHAAAIVLAACWAAVAWAFLWQRFAPINWVASGYAVAFGLQALGLLSLALVVASRHETGVVRRRAAFVLGLWALLGHPLLAAALGRPWQQAEVFGLAPDPTAIGTLAFLLLVDGRTPGRRRLLRALWAVPLGWCAVSAATLATMGSAQGWVLLAAATLAVAAALCSLNAASRGG